MPTDPAPTELLSFDPATGAVEAIAKLADEGADPVVLNQLLGLPDGAQAAVLAHPARVLVEQLDISKHFPHPQRKAGDRRFHNPESFGRYVADHRTTATAVYVDTSNPDAAALALLDDHTPEADDLPEAGWGEHRATLGLRAAPDWARWKQANGRKHTQRQFADLLEELSPRLDSDFVMIEQPPAAELLELVDAVRATATTKAVTSGVTDNGGTKVGYEREVRVRTGRTSDVEFPAQLVAVSLVFDASPNAYRFRVRLVVDADPDAGAPTITPHVVQLALIEREAAQDMVDTALGFAGADTRHYHGRP